MLEPWLAWDWRLSAYRSGKVASALDDAHGTARAMAVFHSRYRPQPSPKEQMTSRRALIALGLVCQVPICTSRRNPQIHRLWPLALGGTLVTWNRVFLCGFHHPAVQAGILVIGGVSPHYVITKIAIDPRTGEPLRSLRQLPRTSWAERLPPPG